MFLQKPLLCGQKYKQVTTEVNTACNVSLYFLFFARRIEESLEQCVASKTYLETSGLHAFLEFIDIWM